MLSRKNQKPKKMSYLVIVFDIHLSLDVDGFVI